MSVDDGPVLIGVVLSLGWGLGKASLTVAKFLFGVWLVVAKIFWRQAHFVVGIGLSIVCGVFLSLLLDTNVGVTVLCVSVTNWWLFLPTEDLVWMRRRGYVSPACVRVLISVLANFLGVGDEVEKKEMELMEALTAKVGRYTGKLGTLKTVTSKKQATRWREGAVPDGKGVEEEVVQGKENDDESDEDNARHNNFVFDSSSDSDDDSVSKAKTHKLRVRKLKRTRNKRLILTPVRQVLRAIMRYNGLLPGLHETEHEARRRRSGIGGDDETRDGTVDSISGNHVSTSNTSQKQKQIRRNIPKRPLPAPETWPHRPVFVRFSPRDNGTQRALAGWATRWGPELGSAGEKTPPPLELQNCPVNTESSMHFESELFIGTIVCRFKGITCPANAAASKTPDAFFKKKRCTFQVLVQGRFKEEIACDKIVTGGEFHKPFTERPPNYLVSAGCKFFAALTPGLELDLLCDEPYYTATLGGTVTTLSIDDEQDAPDPLSDVSERNAKLGGVFGESWAPGNIFALSSASVREDNERNPSNLGSEKETTRSQPASPESPLTKGSGLSVSRRCRVLGDPQTAKNYKYNTTDVYTFDYFQSVLLFDVYCLDIGIVKLKLDRHVDGQPLGIMAKHQDGRYLYNFEIFHECLLAKTDQGRCKEWSGGLLPDSVRVSL